MHLLTVNYTFNLTMVSEVSCGPLNTIEFSTNTTTQGDNLYLDQITVSCISGYQQNGGDLGRNCISAGTWDGTEASCTSQFYFIFLQQLQKINHTLNLAFTNAHFLVLHERIQM